MLTHNSIYQKGLTCYKNKEYSQAVTMFETLVNESKQCEPRSLYFLAASLMQLDQPNLLIEARGYLVTACIISHNNSKCLEKLEECQQLIKNPKKISVAHPSQPLFKSPNLPRVLTQAEHKIFPAQLIAKTAKSDNPLFSSIAKNTSLADIKNLVRDNKAIALSLDSQKNNAIHIAIVFNRPDLIETFINNGTDINTKNIFGIAPIHLCILAGDNVEMLNTLLVNGADALTNVPIIFQLPRPF